MYKIDLTNQRAIVTGSSTGIGRGIAAVLAQAGADVAGCCARYARARRQHE